MNAEGELLVRVGVSGQAVSTVGVSAARPAVAERVLSGRPVNEAVAMVPRLFSICGHAQAMAAQLAATASAEDPARSAAPVSAAFDSALIAEAAFDTLWRVLVDWRRALGVEPDSNTLGGLRSVYEKRDSAALRAVVERELLDEACDTWLDGDLCAFERWLEVAPTAAARLLAAVFEDDPRQGAADTPLLPSFADAATIETVTASLFLDPQFERAPHWAGQPAETGALARTQRLPRIAAAIRAYGRGTLARLLARLTELAQAALGRRPVTPLAGRCALGDGCGLGWAETARGAVLHLIERADAGRSAQVLRYRIVAPTEWNFHPRGALPAGLAGAAAADDTQLRRRVSWLIGALDPCVTWRLEIGHA